MEQMDGRQELLCDQARSEQADEVPPEQQQQQQPAPAEGSTSRLQRQDGHGWDDTWGVQDLTSLNNVQPCHPAPLEEVKKIKAKFSESCTPRVYEVMPSFGGNTRFLCRGLCVTGPRAIDVGYNILTWSMIIMPSGFYYVFCSEEFWSINPILPLTTTLLLVVAVTLLLLTSCTDPGIIPRHAVRLMVENLHEEVNAAIGCEVDLADVLSGEKNEQLMAELSPLGFRWCSYCRHIMPPRAKHCRDCDCCVMRSDHHCPFVNNCVGQRNYAYFIGLLAAALCLGVCVITQICFWFLKPEGGWNPGRGVRTAILVLCALPALLCIGVMILGIFHMMLICRGRTTREALTRRNVHAGPTLFAFRGRSLVPTRRHVRWPSFDV